jgi:hypothetical protein
VIAAAANAFGKGDYARATALMADGLPLARAHGEPIVLARTSGTRSRKIDGRPRPSFVKGVARFTNALARPGTTALAMGGGVPLPLHRIGHRIWTTVHAGTTAAAAADDAIVLAVGTKAGHA